MLGPMGAVSNGGMAGSGGSVGNPQSVSRTAPLRRELSGSAREAWSSGHLRNISQEKSDRAKKDCLFYNLS